MGWEILFLNSSLSGGTLLSLTPPHHPRFFCLETSFPAHPREPSVGVVLVFFHPTSCAPPALQVHSVPTSHSVLFYSGPALGVQHGSTAPLLASAKSHPIAYVGPELILAQLLALCHPTSLLARSSGVNGQIQLCVNLSHKQPEGEAWLFPAVPLALL